MVAVKTNHKWWNSSFSTGSTAWKKSFGIIWSHDMCSSLFSSLVIRKILPIMIYNILFRTRCCILINIYAYPLLLAILDGPFRIKIFDLSALHSWQILHLSSAGLPWDICIMQDTYPSPSWLALVAADLLLKSLLHLCCRLCTSDSKIRVNSKTERRTLLIQANSLK